MPNLYDAVGVSADASADKIKRRTRKLINEVRESDKRNAEKNELIRFFKRARETLCDPDARREYDRSIGIETIDTTEATETIDTTEATKATEATEATEFTNVMGDNDDSIIGAKSLVPFETFPMPFQPLSALSALGALGNIGFDSPMSSPRSSRSPASSVMGLIGADMHDMLSSDMLSKSIIPQELAASSSGKLKPGTFHFLEYTKVRNPDGGFDEFGFTRQGDIRNERVTEKRFERKS